MRKCGRQVQPALDGALRDLRWLCVHSVGCYEGEGGRDRERQGAEGRERGSEKGREREAGSERQGERQAARLKLMRKRLTQVQPAADGALRNLRWLHLQRGLDPLNPDALTMTSDPLSLDPSP